MESNSIFALSIQNNKTKIMSNKTKHTGGEWVVNDRHIENEHGARMILIDVPDYSLLSIISVYYSDDLNDKEEAEANAKLIAAAPDLLEALTAMIDGKERDFSKLSEKALAAIKKATK